MPSSSPQATVPVATTSALARHLGLSRWTVSRVLNGHPGVHRDTVARVQAAMAELGFTPDPLARGLRGGRSGTIGVCFQELESPILARKTATLQRLLREAGFRALIELTNGQPDLEDSVVRHFLSVRVEAVVLLGSALRSTDPVVALLRSAGVPVVTIDPEHRLPFTDVTLDRPAAMTLALEHLYAAGHRRFALLGLDPANAYGAARWAGLRSSARRLGVALRRDVTSHFRPGHLVHDYAYGADLAEQFLRARSDATGLLAVNDRVALGAIHRLRAADRMVPRDLSVIGYDNLDVGPHVVPELTTIDQQVGLMMQMATSLLLAGLQGGGARSPVRQVVQPVLVQRGSVGPAAS